MSSDAVVHLADGGTKCAREVCVGDKLQTIAGGVTSIRAVLHTAAARRRMVRIGRLLITNNHPVINDEGQWAQPITLPEAKWELTDTHIYTFVTDHQLRGGGEKEGGGGLSGRGIGSWIGCEQGLRKNFYAQEQGSHITAVPPFSLRSGPLCLWYRSRPDRSLTTEGGCAPAPSRNRNAILPSAHS